MDWQTALVYVLVGLALVYLARYFRKGADPGADACGGCASCEAPPAKGPDAPTVNRRS